MIGQAGSCLLEVRYQGKSTSAIFHVVKTNELILLGLQTIRKLSLIILNLAINMNDRLNNNQRNASQK